MQAEINVVIRHEGKKAWDEALRHALNKMPTLAADIREFHREDRAKIFPAMLSVQSAKAWVSAQRARARAARISSAHSHALAAAEMSVKLHRSGDTYASNVWAHHAEICRHNARKLRGAACTP